VAVYFAISARTVYHLLEEGDLRATRIRRFEETLADADQY